MHFRSKEFYKNYYVKKNLVPSSYLFSSGISDNLNANWNKPNERVERVSWNPQEGEP